MPGEDKERVLRWLAEGRLLHPLEGTASSMDLFRALAGRFDDGQSPGREAPSIEDLGVDLSLRERSVVFVLLDGLGEELLELRGRGGFLQSHRRRELRAVFPSTTATVLSSLATVRWPAEHGVTGWFTRIPERGLTVLPLPLTEQTSGDPLPFGPEQIVMAAPVEGSSSAAGLALLPRDLVETPYSLWARSGTAGLGYGSLRQMVRRAVRAVSRASHPLFVYVYVPLVDSLSHRHGPGSEVVGLAVEQVDRALERMAERLAGRATVVVSADHGLVEAPEARRHPVRDGDPILETLECPPSGEPAVPVFHVREGWEDRLRARLAGRTGNSFALLSPDDIEDMRLYGPVPLREKTRRRLGTFVGIAVEPTTLEYVPPGREPRLYPGVHGGLRPGEMRVPLVVWPSVGSVG